jgi:hypothetical protein
MKRACGLIGTLALLWSSLLSASDTTVILGVVKARTALHVEVSCPSGSVCIGVWGSYEVAVKKVLAGRHVSGVINLAREESEPLPADQLGLLVMSSIDDASRKRQLRSEFTLEDLSFAHPLYCTSHPLGEYGVPSTEPAMSMKGNKYCYQPEVVER